MEFQLVSGSSRDTVSFVSRDQPTILRLTLIPILQVWKFGHREVNSLARGPRANTWQIQSQECPLTVRRAPSTAAAPAALRSQGCCRKRFILGRAPGMPLQAPRWL